MRKTTKAVLLSALAFPGCGHLWLKSKLMAWLLISITVAAIYFLLSNALDIANEISAKILSGEIPLDVARISDAVSAGISASTSQQMTMVTWTLVICWLVGIADSYRIAKKTS